MKACQQGYSEYLEIGYDETDRWYVSHTDRIGHRHVFYGNSVEHALETMAVFYACE